MTQKITSKSFSEIEKIHNYIPMNYVFIGTDRKFSNYSINDNGIMFADTDNENILKNKKTDNVFFNTTDTLASIVNLGRQTHNILKNELVNPLISSSPTKLSSDIVTFVDLKQELKNIKDKKLLSNSFINNFVSQDILKSHITDIRPLVIEFCEKNGMPYLEMDYNDEGIPFYYCKITPFISLSIIIYILFEAQDIVKGILELKEKKPTSKNNTIGFLMNSNEYRNWDYNIKEYLKRLENILWFFYVDVPNNLKNIEIYYISNFITNCCEIIERETSYIKTFPFPKFYTLQNRFVLEEKHENLLSIAWSKLKLTMYTNNARLCATPDCINIFEPNSPKQIYCEKCLDNGQNKRVNSNNSYTKKQNLHKQLVQLYNSIIESKLNKLPKDLLYEIKKYVSYDKAYIIKEKTDTKIIENYIDVLNNLN